MENDLKNAIENRRSYYSITNKSPISDNEIEDIIKFTVKHTPSAFNSQSSTVVLLLGENHKKLWDITLESLRKIVPADTFGPTKAKIDSFSAGYGTVLFFEDSKVVNSLQESFALYAENFPIWSSQTSAMHQIFMWTLLEQRGLGASLQHYSNLIEQEVLKNWNLPQTWKLMAQMPFGTPTATPQAKTFKPLENRVLVFK